MNCILKLLILRPVLIVMFRRMYSRLLKVFGHIEALVKNTGRGLHASTEDIDTVSYRELLKLNNLALLTRRKLAEEGQNAAKAEVSNIGSVAYSPERVAEKMLGLIQTGERKDDLVTK